VKIHNEFKALSDLNRCKILQLLKKKNMTAGELSDSLGISPASLSYHLDILRKADMVISYKDKNYVVYELNISLMEELVVWLKNIGGFENEE